MTSILVPLGHSGLFACIDEADAIIMSTTWWLDPRHDRKYARRALKNPRVRFYLHRVIANRMGLDPSFEVDHVNGHGLDCRRGNLRSATRSQNMQNRGPSIGSKSRFKGVVWCRFTRRWRARGAVDGKIYELGRFDDPTEAARAYDDFAREHHGAFARPNLRPSNT